MTTEGWPVAPALNRHISEMLEAERLLQGPDVAPLNIIDVEGLEAIESVLTGTKIELGDLLEAHQHSALSEHSFREWLLVTFAPVRPSPRIMGRWDRVLYPVLRAVEDQEGGSPAVDGV